MHSLVPTEATPMFSMCVWPGDEAMYAYAKYSREPGDMVLSHFGPQTLAESINN